MRIASTAIVAAIVIVASCAQSHAQSYGRTTTCARYGGSISCKSEGYATGYALPYRYGAPSVTEVFTARELTAIEIAERDARIAKWEAFCEPVGKVDDLGVTRLSYKYPGCEYGRSE